MPFPKKPDTTEIEEPYVPPMIPRGGTPLANTRFRKEFVDEAFRYCLLGADNNKIARFLGVSEDTINHWITHRPKFAKAVKDGRQAADARVATSMYSRACGYEIEETKVNVVNGEIVETKVIKHVPADIPAAKFWLSNRHRDTWTNSPEIEINADNISISVVHEDDK